MRGGVERFVGNAQVMMFFVSGANAVEDVDGLFHAGLVHDHGLEAALERGVAFDVLAVFVQRGRADDLKFAAG